MGLTQGVWWPQGKNLVLGGLKAMNGQLEFFGVDDMEPYRAAEHFMCTNVEWDPTGRYVATSVTSIHQMENGFNLWLFNGTPLYRWGTPASSASQARGHAQSACGGLVSFSSGDADRACLMPDILVPDEEIKRRAFPCRCQRCCSRLYLCALLQLANWHAMCC